MPRIIHWIINGYRCAYVCVYVNICQVDCCHFAYQIFKKTYGVSLWISVWFFFCMPGVHVRWFGSTKKKTNKHNQSGNFFLICYISRCSSIFHASKNDINHFFSKKNLASIVTSIRLLIKATKKKIYNDFHLNFYPLSYRVRIFI